MADWKEWSAHLHDAHAALTDALVCSVEIIESSDDEDLEDVEKALDRMREGAEGILWLLSVIDPKIQVAAAMEAQEEES